MRPILILVSVCISVSSALPLGLLPARPDFDATREHSSADEISLQPRGVPWKAVVPAVLVGGLLDHFFWPHSSDNGASKDQPESTGTGPDSAPQSLPLSPGRSIPTGESGTGGSAPELSPNPVANGAPDALPNKPKENIDPQPFKDNTLPGAHPPNDEGDFKSPDAPERMLPGNSHAPKLPENPDPFWSDPSTFAGSSPQPRAAEAELRVAQLQNERGFEEGLQAAKIFGQKSAEESQTGLKWAGSLPQAPSTPAARLKAAALNSPWKAVAIGSVGGAVLHHMATSLESHLMPKPEPSTIIVADATGYSGLPQGVLSDGLY